MYGVRMLKTHRAAPAYSDVYTYTEGEVYGESSSPPLTDALMQSFVAQGIAVEVDAEGNPTNPPASKRSTKGAANPPVDQPPSTDGDAKGEGEQAPSSTSDQGDAGATK